MADPTASLTSNPTPTVNAALACPQINVAVRYATQSLDTTFVIMGWPGDDDAHLIKAHSKDTNLLETAEGLCRNPRRLPIPSPGSEETTYHLVGFCGEGHWVAESRCR